MSDESAHGSPAPAAAKSPADASLCPPVACQHAGSLVLATRGAVRYRRCPACGTRWRTTELGPLQLTQAIRRAAWALGCAAKGSQREAEAWAELLEAVGL